MNTHNLPVKPFLVEPLREGTLHFFDTNFLLLPKVDLPNLGIAPKDSRWITETTKHEIIDKLGKKITRDIVDGKFHVLRFNDLYRQDPGICPVYYFFILAMYNPAIIGNEDIMEEFYMSTLRRGETLNDQEKKIYEKNRKRSSHGHMLDKLGNPKPEFIKYLENLQSRTSRKAKLAAKDPHPAYLRDIRILSLLLYYSLTSKKDVVLYTADGDPISLLFKWLNYICFHLSLTTTILPRIGSDGEGTLMEGGLLKFYLEYKDVVDLMWGMYKDLVNDRWKTEGVCFKIRHWDQTQHLFKNDIWLTFPEEIAQVISNMHGNYSCHYSKNNTNGNWLQMSFYWPPKPPEKRIYIEVTKKDIVNKTSVKVLTEQHDHICKYRKEDASGEIATWSDFQLPKPGG